MDVAKYISREVVVIYKDRQGNFTQRPVKVIAVTGNKVSAYDLSKHAPRIIRRSHPCLSAPAFREAWHLMSKTEIDIENLKLIQDHVEIMTLAELAVQQHAEATGTRTAITKIVGSFLQGELERSIGRLKERRIWVKDKPERSGLKILFTYSVAGQRGLYEVERATLFAYMTERIEDYSDLISKVQIPHYHLRSSIRIY